MSTKITRGCENSKQNGKFEAYLSVKSGLFRFYGEVGGLVFAGFPSVSG
jgi:hypothetical protein